MVAEAAATECVPTRSAGRYVGLDGFMFVVKLMIWEQSILEVLRQKQEEKNPARLRSVLILTLMGFSTAQKQTTPTDTVRQSY